MDPLPSCYIHNQLDKLRNFVSHRKKVHHAKIPLQYHRYSAYVYMFLRIPSLHNIHRIWAERFMARVLTLLTEALGQLLQAFLHDLHLLATKMTKHVRRDHRKWHHIIGMLLLMLLTISKIYLSSIKILKIKY